MNYFGSQQLTEFMSAVSNFESDAIGF